ncbi:hypothetical protein [Pragia fontium]|uniref:hypothetical protein n=1 Tax=Pragia fontium TaxID=82985 RepID=UPI000F6EBD46|nr:hypothetical protein [Pragia fontium]VEJ56076.1 Uncharacterised protein [Pragia fontium]
MGKILVVSLLSLFVLAGCNSTPTVGNWFKINTSAEEADNDRIQCETESKLSANPAFHRDPVGEVDSDQVIDSGLIREQQQINLVGECMRAKGYSND